MGFDHHAAGAEACRFPGIVNNFIGLFKDTTLVLIISMFDLLGVVKQNFPAIPPGRRRKRPRPATCSPRLIFWVFCFGMSRYSMFMERRLDTGHRR